ncbi:MAG: GatB/YqeY domain-containing protein [Methyloligellaceae bacterium]
MRDQISNQLKTALKAQKKREVSTLRLIMAAIKDRDIASRSKGKDGVDDQEILEILAKMIKQRQESVKTYEEAGRLELAEAEQEEIEIISGFLPQQLNKDETRSAVETVIQEIGATSLKDMGRTMSLLKERYAGQMDFSVSSSMVKEILG